MNSLQLKRVVNLIRRTGDRCLLLDNESDDVLTLMRLEDYEKLLNTDTGRPIQDLSEREMMEKVNRDIAYWRSFQQEENKKEKDWSEFAEDEGCNCEECGCDECDCDECDCEEDDEEKMEKEFKEEDSENEPKTGILVEKTAEEPVVEKIMPENQFAGRTEEEKIDDLPEEEQDTFLLEPV